MIAGPEEIAAAALRLKDGGVVAFPTETVYGLGADALNPDAVRRVYELKGRPAHNPLIVHVTGVAMARPLTREWPARADMLAREFWPGPLTLVLPKSGAVPELVTAGSPNVALRCPDHPTALSLLAAFGGPLVGPSANLSGRVSPTAAEHVRETFDPAAVLVLDGGPCRAGIESTVLRLTRDGAEILRPGLVTPAQIAEVLGQEPRTRTPAESPDAPLDSPGRLASHYAPLARARLVTREEVLITLKKAGPRAVALVLGACPGEWARDHHVIEMPVRASDYAARLYAALREADRLDPPLIVIESPRVQTGDPDAPMWAAVLDRLRRACT